jgi:hypothetical protein
MLWDRQRGEVTLQVRLTTLVFLAIIVCPHARPKGPDLSEPVGGGSQFPHFRGDSDPPSAGFVFCLSGAFAMSPIRIEVAVTLIPFISPLSVEQRRLLRVALPTMSKFADRIPETEAVIDFLDLVDLWVLPPINS